MTPTIAILGAGPSGLVLARLLEINSIDYVVFERDPTPDTRGQGGSLDIHKETGQKALEAAGLMNEFNKLARYEDQAALVVAQDGRALWNRKFEGQADKPEIDRKDLRDLLLRSIPRERVRWNYRVQSVWEDEDGLMSVAFVDGSVEKGFKLVVGADGGWSKARSLITAAKPKFSGFYYLQSHISPSNPQYPTVEELIGHGTGVIVGSAKQIALQRFGDGSYNIYIGIRLPESWSQENTEKVESKEFGAEMVRKHFADWPSKWTDCVTKADGEWMPWPLYHMQIEELNWNPVPGVTLIGDAAHLSTPFVGEGVNCSIYDSLQLAEEIKKFGIENLDEAVAEYERKMLPRAIDLITRSNGSGDVMFSDNVVEFFQSMSTTH